MGDGQVEGARSVQGPCVGRGEEGKGTQAEDKGGFRGGDRYAVMGLAPHMARTRFSMLLAVERLSQRYCKVSSCIAVMFWGGGAGDDEPMVQRIREQHSTQDPRPTTYDPRREADGATRRLRQHRTCHGSQLVGRGRHSVDDSSAVASAGRGRGRRRGMRHEA